MKKSSAKIRIISYSIVAVVLTILLVWGIGSGNSCTGVSCGAVNLGGYYYSDSNLYKVGEFELEEEINSIDVDWISGNVKLEIAKGEYVYAKETGAGDEDHKLRYRVENGKLIVKFKKAERFSFDTNKSKELTIYVPEEMAKNMKNISIQCVSAGLNITEYTADEINIEMVSGKIYMKDVTVDTIDLENVSGDVEIFGSINKADMELVSGEVKITSDKQLSKIDIETVSGDVTINMPEGDGFTAEMDSVSGDLNVEFEVTTNGKKRVNKNGSGEYNFDTVSGDVDINKIK